MKARRHECKFGTLRFRANWLSAVFKFNLQCIAIYRHSLPERRAAPYGNHRMAQVKRQLDMKTGP